MKKRWYTIAVIMIFLLILIYLLKLNYDKTYDVKPSDTIIVGGIDDMEPYSYVDRHGKYTGFNVEVMNLIAETLDVKIIYKRIDIEDIKEELESERVDLVLGAQYGIESFEGFSYTKPFIKNHFNIYVDNSSNNIRNIDDFKNKIISVYRWDPAYQRVKNIKDVRLYICDSQADAYAFLKNGMADAYVANSSLAFNYVEEPLYSGKIKTVGGKIDVFPSGAVALKDNTELINLINAGIDKVKSGKKIDELYEKWFGSRLMERQNFLYKILYSFIVVGLILLLVLVFIYRVNKILKKQVHDKTEDIRKEIEFKKEIINSISDLIVTVDTDLVITTINNKQNIFGSEKKLAEIGKSITDTKIMEIVNYQEIKDIIIGDKYKINAEKSINVNGMDCYFDYSISKINIGEKIVGATIVIEDITDKVIMKNNLVMKDKMRTIGQLTAGIAHEIRNPLTSIDVYVKLLPDQIHNDEFVNQLLEDLPSEVERMNRIIEELLNYAKPNHPNIVLLDVKYEIENIIRLMKKNKDCPNIAINVHVDDGIIIPFDINNFKQIMINLLSNSIDAVRKKDKAKIKIYSNQYERAYELIIEDNGEGINEKNINNIFEPLFTTKKEGNGFGLAVVSQLIKENNAFISVKSEFGGGTKFTIKIIK